jgi:hypothetical protein
MPMPVDPDDLDLIDLLHLRAMEQTDHDLLVRIDERVSQMQFNLGAELGRQDTRMKNVESQVDSLRISRAEMYGYTSAISAVVGILIKFFWH